jgi:hypothetical protein
MAASLKPKEFKECKTEANEKRRTDRLEQSH